MPPYWDQEKSCHKQLQELGKGMAGTAGTMARMPLVNLRGCRRQGELSAEAGWLKCCRGLPSSLMLQQPLCSLVESWQLLGCTGCK